MIPLPLPRLTLLVAIALAVVCGSNSAHAGVISLSDWDDTALASSANLPTDAPQRDTLSQAEQGGMEGVLLSSISGGQAAALPASLVRLADASVTGRLRVVDLALPEDPFLDGLPKPA